MERLKKKGAVDRTGEEDAESSLSAVCGVGTASDRSLDREVESPPAKIPRESKVRGVLAHGELGVFSLSPMTVLLGAGGDYVSVIGIQTLD